MKLDSSFDSFSVKQSFLLFFIVLLLDSVN